MVISQKNENLAEPQEGGVWTLTRKELTVVYRGVWISTSCTCKISAIYILDYMLLLNQRFLVAFGLILLCDNGIDCV